MVREWGFGPILYRPACYIRGQVAGRRNYFFIYKLRGAAGRRTRKKISCIIWDYLLDWVQPHTGTNRTVILT